MVLNPVMIDDFLSNYSLNGEILPVIKYPDIILSKKSALVESFDDHLVQHCKNMLFTMYQAPGIGLAAPQVGISKRFFVLDIDFDREEFTNSKGEVEFRYSGFSPQVYINPKILETQGEILYQEGCLSVPGVYEDVKRFEKIVVEYQDLLGQKQQLTAEGLLSICIQHETDHLNGVVFIEKLSSIKRNFYKKKLEKEKKRKVL